MKERFYSGFSASFAIPNSTNSSNFHPYFANFLILPDMKVLQDAPNNLDALSTGSTFLEPSHKASTRAGIHPNNHIIISFIMMRGRFKKLPCLLSGTSTFPKD